MPFGLKAFNKVRGHLRQRLLVGLLLLIPLAVTYIILRFVFDGIDGLLQPLLVKASGREIPGAGIISLVIIMYVIGLTATSVMGDRLIRVTQGILLRIPLINTVYNPSKQIIDAFAGAGRGTFKKVVMIEYPRLGMWTLAFVMATMKDEEGEDLVVVYIPTTPTPQSGWLGIMKTDQIWETDISVDTAFRIVLSGGVLSPATLRKRAPIASKEASKS